MTERDHIIRGLSASERQTWLELFGYVPPVIVDDLQHRDASPGWYTRPAHESPEKRMEQVTEAKARMTAVTAA